jgi:hypothetical protein
MTVSKFIFVALIAFAGNASANFAFDSIWTGRNNFSSAPHPACPCDLDKNQPDCPLEFAANLMEEDFCYDEFIPANSSGWVNARIFKK